MPIETLDQKLLHGHIAAAANACALDWARSRLGAAGAERVLARALGAGHARAEVEGRSGGPVSLASHLAVLAAIEAEAGADALLDLGRANAAQVDRVVPGAGMMLKLASPARLVKHAPTLWRTYCDFGRVTVLAAEKRAGALEFDGVPDDPRFCACLQGFFTGLLDRCGGHGARITPFRSPTGWRFEGAWS